jgi:hypothetical protein
MKYDIDSALSRVDGQPWELSLTLGGRDYPTRPLTIGDIDGLPAMNSLHLSQQRAAIADLFAEPKPVLAEAEPARLAAIVSAIIGYQQARAAKNSRAIAAEVAAIAIR